jgi:hypothetical protein
MRRTGHFDSRFGASKKLGATIMAEEQSDDLTIKQFCKRNGLCKASYYELRKRGQAPREMRVLSRVKITPEAEAAWREARQTPDKKDLATIERLHGRGRKGGRRSANTSSDNSPEAA